MREYVRDRCIVHGSCDYTLCQKARWVHSAAGSPFAENPAFGTALEQPPIVLRVNGDPVPIQFCPFCGARLVQP